MDMEERRRKAEQGNAESPVVQWLLRYRWQLVAACLMCFIFLFAFMVLFAVMSL